MAYAHNSLYDYNDSAGRLPGFSSGLYSGSSSGLYSTGLSSGFSPGILQPYWSPPPSGVSSQALFLTKMLGIKQSTASALLNYAKITTMEKTAPSYDIIKTYFKQSQVEEHLEEYDWNRLRLCKIFKVSRPQERHRFRDHDYSNDRRLLLWHGTGKKNLLEIMKSGLIKPGNPGMFGDGIYFADRVTKSAQYCRNKQKRDIIKGRNSIILCSVAVGSMYRISEKDNSIKRPPAGYDSIKGVGLFEPDPRGDITTSNGKAIAKAGETRRNPKVSNSTLKYNEYVVYTRSRVMIVAIVAYEPE